MATIYLVLYVLLGLGNPAPAANTGNAVSASAVSGDAFKAPF
jgi:hypothetical protein